MKYCSCCYNQNTDICKSCDDQGKQFRPQEAFSEYFFSGYTGSTSSIMWIFKGDNPSIKPTTSIIIGSAAYCPYCGESMFTLYDARTECKRGSRCFCHGAQSELRYNELYDEMLTRHSREVEELKGSFKDALKIDKEALIELKHKNDKKHIYRLSDLDSYLTLQNLGDRTAYKISEILED